MARPRRQYQGSLSPGQSHYVLERLIGERRVSATEIDRYVSEMGREISNLEARLARLRDAAGPAAAAAAAGIAAGVAGAAAVRAGRRRGRPPGSGKKAAAAATARPGRPGRPGRPPGSGKKAGRPAGATAGAANAQGNAGAAAKGGAKRGRKARAAITPEQLASRQLQGRYLALVRQFPEGKRAQYAKLAKEKGREAAINQMQADSKK